MSLSDFTPETREVPLNKAGDKTLTVRGLNLDDLTFLVSNHLGDIATGMELYQQHKTAVIAENSLDRFIVAMMRVLPDLSAEIIAVACDEPERGDNARKLPLAIQIAALSEIASLTMEEAGGLKNLFAALASLIGAMMPAHLQAQAQLRSRTTDTE